LKGRIAAPLAIAAALIGAADLSAQSHAAAPSRYVVAPVGNEARYKVMEQLANIGLNEVVGTTKDVTGRIILDASGKVVKDSSKIVVNVSTLTTDQKRRDNYLKTKSLESTKFPEVTLVPVSFDGLSEPIPAGQSKTFSLVGNLTVRDVTRPTTWQVTARRQGNDIVGTAKTMFTFKDFNMDQPKVPIVLSVADTIKLEYDFHFAPDVAK
jgi:polyisoprenoid-binding protein YceI